MGGLFGIFGFVSAAISWFGGKIGEAASGLIGDIFEWIVALLMQGVIWLFQVVMDFVSEATTPSLREAWFTNGPMNVARVIATALLALFFILAIAEAVWNRDGGQLLRSVGQDIPKAMFMLLTLIFMTEMAIGLTDSVAAMSMDLFRQNIVAIPAKLTEFSDGLAFGLGLLVVALAALFLVLALIFVAFELVVREALILVLVPITAALLATEVYRPTKGMGARALRLLGIAVVSKAVIALCLAIGAAAIGREASEMDRAEYTPEPEPELSILGPDDFVQDWAEYRQEVWEWWSQRQAARDIPAEFIIPANCCTDLELIGDGTGEHPITDGGPGLETHLAAELSERLNSADDGGADGDEAAEATEQADTSAVAPVFGLVLAGLAVMVLAAFSPFLMMRLITIEPGVDSQAWRKAISSSAKSAGAKATSAVGAGSGAGGAAGRSGGQGANGGGGGGGGELAGSAARKAAG